MRTILFAAALFVAGYGPAFAAKVDDQVAIAIAKPHELIVDRSLSTACRRS